MTASNYDIVIEQGSKFNLTIIYKDSTGSIIDLTGYTCAMQVRQYVDSTSSLISLSNGSGITITGANGQIDIEINATDTASLSFINGVYDIEITPASGVDNTVRIMQGKATLSKEVTR